jgi:hypothetical protein
MCRELAYSHFCPLKDDIMFYIAALVPSHDKPEQYTYGTVHTEADSYLNAEDLLSDLLNEGNHVFELGVDELPSGAEDIRESLLCKPARVFVSMLFGEPDYFCIVELP